MSRERDTSFYGLKKHFSNNKFGNYEPPILVENVTMVLTVVPLLQFSKQWVRLGYC